MDFDIDNYFRDTVLSEKTTEINPDIFRNLPDDMLNLVLQYAGPNGMSVSKKMRNIFLKNGVSIKSISKIKQPVYEGLYLLLRYAKSIHYSCLRILMDSYSTDLPNLEVLKITGSGTDLYMIRIHSFRMPKLHRIIFRPDGYVGQNIYSTHPFTYFCKMTQEIKTNCYIDAEFEYNGNKFRENFTYRKITVKQSLLKGMIINFMECKNYYKKIKKIVIYIQNWGVFDNLYDSEILALRDVTEKIVVCDPNAGTVNKNRLIEFHNRFKTAFDKFSIKLFMSGDTNDIPEIPGISMYGI